MKAPPPIDPDEFIRALAHDLVNPLCSIEGFLQLLLDPAAKDALTPRQRRMLVAMERASTHMLGLMRDVSDLSRMERGDWASDRTLVDWKAAADKVFRDYRILAENRRVSMTIESPADLPRTPSDDRMADRLLDALTRMAGRMTPEGGRIRLRFSHAKKKLSLELSHTGESLRPEVWRRMLAATIGGPRPDGGYGAATPSLCRQIVEAMGGSFSIEPLPEGGTSFSAQLPLS